jgi:hypothetical protein
MTRFPAEQGAVAMVSPSESGLRRSIGELS